MLAVLVIAFLVGAPFAATASGSWALARAREAQLAERASSYQVPALVLKFDASSGVLLTITGLLMRWVLDRRRMAAWDAEWRATGPRWTTRA